MAPGVLRDEDICGKRSGKAVEVAGRFSPDVTFGSDRIRTYRGKDEKANPDVPREGRKGESGGQLLTVHHRTRAGGNEVKNRGD